MLEYRKTWDDCNTKEEKCFIELEPSKRRACSVEAGGCIRGVNQSRDICLRRASL